MVFVSGAQLLQYICSSKATMDDLRKLQKSFSIAQGPSFVETREQLKGCIRLRGAYEVPEELGVKILNLEGRPATSPQMEVPMVEAIPATVTPEGAVASITEPAVSQTPAEEKPKEEIPMDNSEVDDLIAEAEGTEPELEEGDTTSPCEEPLAPEPQVTAPEPATEPTITMTLSQFEAEKAKAAAESKWVPPAPEPAPIPVEPKPVVVKPEPGPFKEPAKVDTTATVMAKEVTKVAADEATKEVNVKSTSSSGGNGVGFGMKVVLAVIGLLFLCVVLSYALSIRDNVGRAVAAWQGVPVVAIATAVPTAPTATAVRQTSANTYAPAALSAITANVCPGQPTRTDAQLRQQDGGFVGQVGSKNCNTVFEGRKREPGVGIQNRHDIELIQGARENYQIWEGTLWQIPSDMDPRVFACELWQGKQENWISQGINPLPVRFWGFGEGFTCSSQNASAPAPQPQATTVPVQPKPNVPAPQPQQPQVQAPQPQQPQAQVSFRWAADALRVPESSFSACPGEATSRCAHIESDKMVTYDVPAGYSWEGWDGSKATRGSGPDAPTLAGITIRVK